MIRIVCPHCHASLIASDLEQATLGGHLCLLCPECVSVLVSEPLDEGETRALEDCQQEPSKQLSNAADDGISRI